MSERQERQLGMWRRWKGGDAMALDELLKDLTPIIVEKTNFLTRSSQLPRSAVEAQVKVQTIRALSIYDPNRGAQIGTHVVSQLPKANRFIMDHAQVGRIPEHRRLKVSSFLSAQGVLMTSLGREPTTRELMDELSWPEKEIKRLRTEIRREVSAESLPSEEIMFDNRDDQVREAMAWVVYDLTPEEEKVFEHRTGWGGAELLSNSQLARRMKKTERDIRSIRERISKKLGDRLSMVVE